MGEKTEKAAGEELPQGWKLSLNCPEGSPYLGPLLLGPWVIWRGSSLYCYGYCREPCCFLVSWEEFAGWNVQVTKRVLGKVKRRVKEKAPSLELSLSLNYSGLHQLCSHHFCDDQSCSPPDQGDLGLGAGCPGVHSF